MAYVSLVRKVFFLSLLCTGLYGTLHAQEECTLSIQGKVVDLESGEPLPFATIKIVQSGQGAVSDAQGSFFMDQICEQEVDLEVRHVGYKTLFHHHDIHHADPTIYLASDENMLESVIVEKERNVHNLKSLTTKTFQFSPLSALGSNTSDLLSQASGVSVLKTGQNIVKPIVHGLHSNRVLVINNGVRHANQSWGDDHGLEIDASQIDQINVVKGAATIRYGSEALGGVILLNAPAPAFRSALSGNVASGFQTNGRSFSGEANVEQGYERIAWRASFSGIHQGDLSAPDYQLTNTGKRELNLSANTKLHLPKIDVDVLGSHFTQKLGILRGAVSGNFENFVDALNDTVPDGTAPFSYALNTPRQEVAHTLLRLKSTVFSGDHQLDIQYAFQRNKRQEFDVRRGENNERPAINLDMVTHSLDATWDVPSDQEWVSALGLQLSAQDNNNVFGTNTIPFVPNFNIYSAGLFAIKSFTTHTGDILEMGGRLDLQNINVRGRDTRNDIYKDQLTYENITFTIGYKTVISDRLSFQSNLGAAWRTPNVNELYGFGKHENVFVYGILRYQYFPKQDSISTRSVLTESQKEVKSEQGYKWVAHLYYQSPHWQIELTPHFNYIKNYFYTRLFGIVNNVRGTFPYFLHDQTDAIYTGLDLDVRRDFGSGVESELKVSTIYARDVKNHQYFVGIPPLNVSMTLSKKIGNFTLRLAPTFEGRKRQTPPVVNVEAFANGEAPAIRSSGNLDLLPAPDPFFLLNASLLYEKNNVSFSIRGENLLNTRYRRYTDNLRYYADDLGINLGLFLSYAF